MAMIKCPECGKEFDYVAAHQQDVCCRKSLIAMGLCIVGAVFQVIYAIFNFFVQYENYLSMTKEEYRLWVVKNSIELTGFNLIGAMSAICVGLAFLMWLMRDRVGKSTPLAIGTVICIVMLLVKALGLIPKPVWAVCFYPDESAFNDFLSYKQLFGGLLSVALGITFFFMKSKGRIKGLTITVGVLFVISYLDICLYGFMGVAHMERPDFMDTIVFNSMNSVVYLGLLVVSIILFHSTYKQSSQPDSQGC